MFRAPFIVCLLFLPFATSASVYISEIAWMGSSASANHEWIELHNQGSAVDVTGWTVVDSNNLTIELIGTLSANSYEVLERTSDASAPGSAFVIYTGALVNTGTTLKLLRADGTVVDQVSGGEDWQSVGGDNATKQTAQYSSAGWVTAVATPGRGLSASDISTLPEETTNNDTATPSTKSKSSSNKSSASESVRLIIPGVTLKLDIDAQTIGYVHQPITFDVEPTGIGKVLQDSLAYEWNFGDGMTAEHKTPEHVFRFPGTYIVHVYAHFKRQEQVARHEITILPVTVSITKNKNGDVQINNDAQYEIDISGYRLRAQEVFVFPARSVILPNQTITIPKEKLGNTTNILVGIHDTQGLLLHTVMPSSLALAQTEVTQLPAPQIRAVAISRPPVQDSSAFGFNQPTDTPPSTGQVPSQLLAETPPDSAADTTPETSAPNQLAAVGAATNRLPAEWPYFALALLLIISTIGIFITTKQNKDQ